MGYGGARKDAGEAIGKGGNEGIDGIISEDLLGLDQVYLQARDGRGRLGGQMSNGLSGPYMGNGLGRVFITTSSFSTEAIGYVQTIEPRVLLIDGAQLTEFMIDFGIGVTEERSYNLKRIDSDFLEI